MNMDGLPPLKKYRVNLVNGTHETVQAQAMTYDNVGNLNFFNQKKTLATANNPEGFTVELVKCFNNGHYISYEPAPTIQ